MYHVTTVDHIPGSYFARCTCGWVREVRGTVAGETRRSVWAARDEAEWAAFLHREVVVG